MNYAQLKALLVASAANKPTANFSAADVHEAARKALAEYLGVDGDNDRTIRHLNPRDFAIIEEVIEEVMPMELQNILGPWSEVKTYGYNDAVEFTVESSASERRFMDVVVPGQAAGIYRARRLDRGSVSIETQVLTAAYNVTLHEILSGQANIAKLVSLIAAGFARKIYLEVIAAFRAMTPKFEATEATAGTLDLSQLDRLIAQAGAYGPVTIFGFRSALSLLSNEANVTDGEWTPNRAAEDLTDIRNHGRVLIYKGTPIVQLENYLLSDDSWAFNENKIYIIPGAYKPVKVALHGPVHTEEVKIPSSGFEWHAHRRVGVGVVTAGGIATYELPQADVETGRW